MRVNSPRPSEHGAIHWLPAGQEKYADLDMGGGLALLATGESASYYTTFIVTTRQADHVGITTDFMVQIGEDTDLIIFNGSAEDQVETPIGGETKR
jgi:hypothetical protein